MNIKFIVLTNPIPWRRAGRVGERYYTQTKVMEYQEEIIAAFLEECWNSEYPVFPKGTNVGLALKFYRGDKRKVDLDNLEKAVMDALGGYRKQPGYLWQDDSQIKVKQSTLLYDKENPRVEIEAWKLDVG